MRKNDVIHMRSDISDSLEHNACEVTDEEIEHDIRDSSLVSSSNRSLSAGEALSHIETIS